MLGSGPALDWDRLRIFQVVAECGSFTHAAERLRLSQSAISRQVGALEQELGATLFYRNSRGLVPTEQGDLLYHMAYDFVLKLEATRAQLTETTDVPAGRLRVTTTVGFGQGWLSAKLPEFLDMHPNMQVQLILDNDELELNMRYADCAIRLRQPQQPELIQRKLFTVHLSLFASHSYVARLGEPKTIADLDQHRLITFGEPTPEYLKDINILETTGRSVDDPRQPTYQVNSQTSIKEACLLGAGIACLPDYIVGKVPGLMQLKLSAEIPSFDTYFCYPKELKNSAKLKAFRDFIVAKARYWTY